AGRPGCAVFAGCPGVHAGGLLLAAEGYGLAAGRRRAGAVRLGPAGCRAEPVPRAAAAAAAAAAVPAVPAVPGLRAVLRLLRRRRGSEDGQEDGALGPGQGATLPLRRARPSKGGPVHTEAGPSVPRRARPSKDGPVRPEAGPSSQGYA
ncbi:hypothetical protein T484DRAFT_1887553, partial [Baffinella frigidus]